MGARASSAPPRSEPIECAPSRTRRSAIVTSTPRGLAALQPTQPPMNPAPTQDIRPGDGPLVLSPSPPWLYGM